MSELALVGGAGGGGEEAVISISISQPDGLVADGIGAVETMVMLGLSTMPWPRRASSFW